MRAPFLDEQGWPNERMGSDAVHISAASQQARLAALEPLLTELL